MISPILVEHISKLVRLSDEAFGNFYLNHHYFLTSITSNTDFGFVIQHENQIVGYVLGSVAVPSEMKHHLLKGGESINTKFKGTTVIIKHLVIDRHHQHQGWGQQLIAHTYHQLKKDCQQFICVCWKKGNVTPMAQLLLKNKFSLLHTINHYWKEDSVTKPFTCPICMGECWCSAEIYIKKAA